MVVNCINAKRWLVKFRGLQLPTAQSIYSVTSMSLCCLSHFRCHCQRHERRLRTCTPGRSPCTRHSWRTVCSRVCRPTAQWTPVAPSPSAAESAALLTQSCSPSRRRSPPTNPPRVSVQFTRHNMLSLLEIQRVLWLAINTDYLLHQSLSRLTDDVALVKQESVRPRWPYDMRPSARAEKYMCVIVIR